MKVELEGTLTAARRQQCLQDPHLGKSKETSMIPTKLSVECSVVLEARCALVSPGTAQLKTDEQDAPDDDETVPELEVFADVVIHCARAPIHLFSHILRMK